MCIQGACAVKEEVAYCRMPAGGEETEEKQGFMLIEILNVSNELRNVI